MRRGLRALAVALASASAVMASGCAPTEEGSRLASVANRLSAVQFPNPYDLPAVTLTDHGGEPYELRARAAGKVTVLYFGYTHCPDICPITVATLARALELLAPEEIERVHPVFVTLDADRDPPEQLARWLGAMHPSMVGLTGTQAELDAAVRALGYIVPEIQRPESGFYEVAHPSTLFVFTPELLGRFGYPHGETTPPRLAEDLRSLIAFSW